MEFVEEYNKDQKQGYKKRFNPYAYQVWYTVPPFHIILKF